MSALVAPGDWAQSPKQRESIATTHVHSVLFEVGSTAANPVDTTRPVVGTSRWAQCILLLLGGCPGSVAEEATGTDNTSSSTETSAPLTSSSTGTPTATTGAADEMDSLPSADSTGGDADVGGTGDDLSPVAHERGNGLKGRHRNRPRSRALPVRPTRTGRAVTDIRQPARRRRHFQSRECRWRDWWRDEDCGPRRRLSRPQRQRTSETGQHHAAEPRRTPPSSSVRRRASRRHVSGRPPIPEKKRHRPAS